MMRIELLLVMCFDLASQSRYDEQLEYNDARYLESISIERS